MGLGIWMIVDDNFDQTLSFAAVLADSAALAQYASYVLIGVGGFIFIVGFLGCCGALKESQCMLGTVSIRKMFP